MKLTNQASIYSGDAAFIVLCVSEAAFATHARFKSD
jgi:hypothetical protein